MLGGGRRGQEGGGDVIDKQASGKMGKQGKTGQSGVTRFCN